MAIANWVTLEQFLKLPEAEPALEYWRGEVTQKVPPKGPHGAIQYGFGEWVRRLTGPAQPFRVFPETRVTFDGVSTVPDLVVYRRERVPRDANGQVLEDFITPPDVTVEIISPDQSRPKLLDRCRWYVENGVQLAIFADPRRRVIRLFRPGSDSGDLRGSALLDLGDVLPGFALTVEEFFAPLAADWA